MGNSPRVKAYRSWAEQAVKFEDIHRLGKLSIGIDIGSTSSDVAVLDQDGKLLLSNYRYTAGRPVETLAEQLRELFERIDQSRVEFMAATGNAGRMIAEMMDIRFVNEVAAQGEAIGRLYPEFDQCSVIDMGGQDTKLVFLIREDGRIKVRDFALNTVCAAGTGSFLDQQAQRLGISIEDEFSEMAVRSTSVPRMAGRCSVFAKSDMIHLQQQATSTEDIIAGLCQALARNLKSNLGCGREFIRPIIFTGGVAANVGVVRALENVFELEQGELIVPGEHYFTGAMGAVLVASGRDAKDKADRFSIEELESHLEDSRSGVEKATRRSTLNKPSMPVPESRVYSELLEEAERAGKVIDAYLGIDVGSISTNVVVMDSEKRVLSKAYLMTAGRPLEAVRKGMTIVGEEVAGKVRILGAATTGSGRYLTGDFIGADTVINEITAQAAGAAIVNPAVDTIFEIGGQDSKYISLSNGVVVDFEMNHACAAGTGSFLEEQAQRLDINIKDEFAELAFASERPIKLGDRCTVFIESELVSFQQQGATTSDLVAGLSYSIVANYLNRVVGRRKIGNNICFQGGTAFNKAVWSAFESVTGKRIMVPDHHEVTGALGAASIAYEHMEKLRAEDGKRAASKFKGFENLAAVEYSVESFTCEHCSNDCEIKKVQLPNSEPLYYGSRCDRYNLKKRKERKDGAEAFKFRSDMLYQFAGLSAKNKEHDKTKTGPRIGIPMSLVSHQMLPVFGRFFTELGFETVVSGKTTKRVIREGVEFVTAQTCFPVKVAYGHIGQLIDQGVDYIFLPSIHSTFKSFEENNHNHLCPYVQSIAYQAQTAFADRLGKTKILTARMYLGHGDKLMRKSFIAVAKQLGVSGAAAKRAMSTAMKAQESFEESLLQKGRDILENLGEDEKLFVLVARPYNGCDDGVNLELPKKLSELGVRTIPMDMLDTGSSELTDSSLHRNVYWSYGQRILRAAEIVRRDKRLFAIYLSNFSCGPDSFIMTFFKDIMGDKPCLQLELDEHSADAGVITRLEAFLESLKHYKADEDVEDKLPSAGESNLHENPAYKQLRGRTLYIPYMGDCAYGVAAAFRAFGQDAEVMPIANENTLLKGRRFTTGKECLPCAITTGDMLDAIERNGNGHDKVAFFMPGSSGPCRFGMYSCMQRLTLKHAGLEDVPVFAPNQDTSFYREVSSGVGSNGVSEFTKYVWTATVGLDILQKLITRIRPYAVDSEFAQERYEQVMGQWTDAVERRCDSKRLVGLMGEIADQMSAIELDRDRSLPRIGIVGEIYVRSHPFANQNLIDRLEGLGAACDLACVSEWIYYTNFTRKHMSLRHGNVGDWMLNATQDYFQHKIESKIAEPFRRYFGRLTEGSTGAIIEAAKPYMDRGMEGEAILSIGKMIEYHHNNFGGVINVMPFSCMPSTIVSTMTIRLSRESDDMPVLNLSFDGSEDSTLTTRLEAFVEQVRQRSENLSTVGELIGSA